MGWITELCKVYDISEDKAGTKFKGNILLPLYHTLVKSQIEVLLDSNGDLLSSSIVDDDSEIIISVTENSVARSGTECKDNIYPHALCNELRFVAGDYCRFIDDGKDENCYKKFMESLKKWCDSEFTDYLIESVYSYLIKGKLISDLVNQKILEIDDSTGKVNKKFKINKTEPSKCIVRFSVVNKNTAEIENTWNNKRLQQKYINFYESEESEDDFEICYATGEKMKPLYKHPGNISRGEVKAKLISSNDKDNFTYRGRFTNDIESYALGRKTSQKAHLALRWLIQCFGSYIGGDRKTVFVAWESKMNDVPDFMNDSRKPKNQYRTGLSFLIENSENADNSNRVKTNFQYSQMVDKAVKGYKQKLDYNSKIMVMGLRVTSQGRLSVIMYQEYAASDFYDNLQKWYSQVSWHGFFFNEEKKRIDCVSTPIPYDILRYAYGNEREDKGEIKVEADDKVCAQVIRQLYECIVQGAKLPYSLIKALFNKASNPQCYEVKNYNWDRLIDIACAVFRKYYIDTEGAEFNMELDRDCRDRSYLYGRLTALADKMESDTYENDVHRLTNAKQYMSKMISSPFKTWMYLYQRIIPYMDKVIGKSYGAYVNYEKEFQEVTVLFNDGDYEQNEALNGKFFLGFYAQKQDLYKNNTKTDEEK
ncbi:MAG: type I-C CRISPR-associated protein Cas8c/Csd1 [Ruminococcus sp.]